MIRTSFAFEQTRQQNPQGYSQMDSRKPCATWPTQGHDSELGLLLPTRQQSNTPSQMRNNNARSMNNNARSMMLYGQGAPGAPYDGLVLFDEDLAKT